MSAATPPRPRVRLLGTELLERPVALRMPFRFGAVTLAHAPQVFVRASVEVDGERVEGRSAELLSAKWFDKDPSLSNEDNFDQLRRSLRSAAGLYAADARARTAFGLHARWQPAHHAACAADGLNGLIASYGTALVDRAILDGLCRAKGCSVFEAVRANLAGIDSRTTPDLHGVDLDAHFARSSVPDALSVRHTVGLADPLVDVDANPDGSAPADDLPRTLREVAVRYGHRHFKIKLGGDPAADVARLTDIARVLEELGRDYRVTLDGNEQFADAEALRRLFDAIEGEPGLERLWGATLYVEQPIARDRALHEPVHALAARKPLALDESDAHAGVFPVGRALGYAGISSKSCKGFYRALLNAARAAAWNAEGGGRHHFMIAEDLTTQPGIGTQQDLALAALVGVDHVEKNGHHYVDGFGDAPLAEQRRFAEAHPDLYRSLPDGRARLEIVEGAVSLRSLHVPGLAADRTPDWSSLRPLGA